MYNDRSIGSFTPSCLHEPSLMMLSLDPKLLRNTSSTFTQSSACSQKSASQSNPQKPSLATHQCSCLASTSTHLALPPQKRSSKPLHGSSSPRPSRTLRPTLTSLDGCANMSHFMLQSLPHCKNARCCSSRMDQPLESCERTSWLQCMLMSLPIVKSQASRPYRVCS